MGLCPECLFAARSEGRMRRQEPALGLDPRGKAHRPCEFGVKVSVATTLHRSMGGQFIAHVKAPPGDPYDGHTLGVVIPEMEAQIGAHLERVVVDRGCRGHNAPPDHKFGVYICGQKRRVAEAIKRDLRRRRRRRRHNIWRLFLTVSASLETGGHSAVVSRWAAGFKRERPPRDAIRVKSRSPFRGELVMTVSPALAEELSLDDARERAIVASSALSDANFIRSASDPRLPAD